ncbi:p21 protein (Cdc42 Rac)-activated kinase, partial [Tulasnella sp. UAMH 9824]
MQDESKHTLQSDVWAWGCTAFEILTESIPYSTSTKDPAIIRDMDKKLAPGSMDALSKLILGSDVGPACHTGVSSLRSIIPQCWDFDPTQRPISSGISEKIAIPSEVKAHLGAWEDPEGGTSSLRFGDDSRYRGHASQEDVPPYRANPLCINCQKYPQVAGQAFCSKACRDYASSHLRAITQNNASTQKFHISTLAKLVSRFTTKRREISTPYDPVHLTHVDIDPCTGEATGLPKEWEPTFRENGFGGQDKQKNPQAVAETVKFDQDTASAPGKTTDRDIATSPTTSGNYYLGEGLGDNSQATYAGAGQVTPSRRTTMEDEDDGARTGRFKTLAQGAPEDLQPSTHQQQPSILQKILSIGRSRPRGRAGGSPSDIQPSRSAMSVPTITTSTGLQSAEIHTGAQQSSDPLERPVAVKQLQSTDMDPSDERQMRKLVGSEKG